MRLRTVLRAVAAILLLLSAYVIWQDRPTGQPLDVPTLSGPEFYRRSVWIGVGGDHDFEDIAFYRNPTLVLTATSTGWNGAFEFYIQRQDIARAAGTFKVLLPASAQISIPTYSGIDTTIEHLADRVLMTVKVSPAPDSRDSLVSVPVTWRDEESIQRLGYGKTRHVLLTGNAYSGENGRVLALIPFNSRLHLDGAGTLSKATPTAAVAVTVRGARESFTYRNPEPDGPFTSAAYLVYRLMPDVPSTESALGRGLFGSVDVTIEDANRRFLAQLSAQVFFVVVGFALSEIGFVLGELRAA